MSNPVEFQRARTAAATEAAKDWHAQRAADNPIKLARAARIVRVALARKLLSLTDIDPDAVVPQDASAHGDPSSTDGP